MASSILLKLAYAIFTCMVIVAPYVEASQLTEVDSKFFNIVCLPLKVLFEIECDLSMWFHKEPPKGCCAVFKLVQGVEHYTGKFGRQADCQCFKFIAEYSPFFNATYAAGLPDKCNATLPFPFAANANCSRVM